MNASQPLWMPKGSVRAIIALLLILPVTVIALRSNIVLTGDQLIGVVMAVITAYFIDKGRSAS